jgi:hypothetical protein
VTGSDAWAALLDSIEDGLDSFPPVLVDVLPVDPGPVPAALVDSAVRTFQRMAEVETALERHRTEIGRELVALATVKANATRSAAPRVPHFLDTRA